METAEDNKGSFCVSAIKDFMSSIEYKQAKEGEAYYSKHNLTIEQYKKNAEHIKRQAG